MLDDIQLNQILFLDIETVGAYPSYSDLPENLKVLWGKKMAYQLEKDNICVEDSYAKAGIFAEFGKIVCISVGFFFKKGNSWKFRIKSFAGDNEKILLQDFLNLLAKSYNTQEHLLCGHNAKEFDFPYIARRSLINGLKLPKILDIAGKKPWEVKHLDTLDLWKFGDYKHYTSLNLLTTIFDIPTPKDDIDGSEVGRVYWVEKDLPRIVTYCQKDVLAVAQLFLRYTGRPLVKDEDVEIAPN
jgi:3'-5' exonuclease